MSMWKWEEVQALLLEIVPFKLTHYRTSRKLDSYDEIYCSGEAHSSLTKAGWAVRMHPLQRKSVR